ncbi:hypothetical protein HDE_13579 [Halotydeus destructor]|nr:hypothetical protein HDE_13579 [Halotydeus destructor]
MMTRTSPLTALCIVLLTSSCSVLCGQLFEVPGMSPFLSRLACPNGTSETPATQEHVVNSSIFHLRGAPHRFACKDGQLKRMPSEPYREEDVRRSRRQSKLPVKVSQALGFIEMSSLEPCGARIVCELSCNPHTFGQSGAQLYYTLLGYYKSNNLPGVSKQQLSYYTGARQAGLKYNQNRSCQSCYATYNGCTQGTSSLLDMLSHVELVP